MLPTDISVTAAHSPITNRLIQFRLYKTQYDLALAHQSGNLSLAYNLLIGLAKMYRTYRLLPQAIAALEQAIGLARLSANRQQEGGLLFTLAEVCQANGESDHALLYFHRALSIAEEVNDSILKAASLDALRRTKTTIMIEALQRHTAELLPPAVIAPVVPHQRWSSVLLALILFTAGFFLLPIALSQAGVSDSVIALLVIAVSVFGLLLAWRRR